LVGRAFAYDAEHSLTDRYSLAERPAKLKPTEFRLLVHMALTALDTDAVPTYFGSRELSAHGLGRALPPSASDSERASAFQAVKVATSGLLAAGAIRRVRRGREGARARFVLEFAHSPSDSGRAEGREFLPLASTDSLPLAGRNSLPLTGRDFLPDEYEIPTPKEPQEPQEELGEEITIDSGPAHVRPVDNFKAAWTDPAGPTVDRRTGEVSDDWEPAAVESSAA
jgi:hypothetical protein